MKRSPVVDVILPTYNRAEFLERAIDSVLDQDYNNINLIVVDDGSEDNTRSIIDKYDSKNIKYIYQKNQGAAAARNKGIENSQGKYIAFIDSDDVWEPEKISKQLDKMRDEIGLVHCGESVVESGNEINQYSPEIVDEPEKRILYHDFIGSCSKVLVKRRVIEKAGGFDNSLPARQDWDLWIRSLEYCSVDAVHDELVRRCTGHDRISSNGKNVIEGTISVINKNSDKFDNEPKAYAKHCALLSILYSGRNSNLCAYYAKESIFNNIAYVRLLPTVLCSAISTTVVSWLISYWAKAKGREYIYQAIED